ncbi:hypothetical protein ACVI1L_001943 [Bradyrhizobium sp. USDA 4516]
MQIKETIGVSLPSSVEVPPLEDVVVLVDSAGVALGVKCAFSARVRGTRDCGCGLIASKYVEIPLVGSDGEVSGILCHTGATSDARGVVAPRRRNGMRAITEPTQLLVHNINNLLVVIDSGSLLLEGQSDAAHRKAVLGKMQEEIAQGALSSRPLDAEQPCPKPIDGFVSGIRLAAIAGTLYWTLPADIAVRIDIAPDLWAFNADPEELYFALLDLCRNSANAMPRGGTISVTAHNVEPSADAAWRFVEIVVAGDGDGTPEKALLPAPYFTTEAEGGTGRGLTQIRRFAEGRGGTICIKSERGAGTQVRLFLPRVHTAPLQGAIFGTEIAYRPSSNGGVFYVVSPATAMTPSWPANNSGDHFDK